jgi:hypothetical protein
MKCYTWNVALYVAETCTLREIDEKCLESFQNVVLEKDGEDQLARSCGK